MQKMRVGPQSQVIYDLIGNDKDHKQRQALSV